jgi:hypothetical protein
MEWISVNNEIPEREIETSSVSCLLYTKFGSIWEGHYDYKYNSWHLSYSNTEIHGVTHWIACSNLPEPPKQS